MKIEPPSIIGDGMLKKGNSRHEKLYKKGYRTAFCPKCGKQYTGKFLVEVIACSACRYRKIEPDVKN